LAHATDAFGDRPLHSLQPIEIDLWRSTRLPPRSAQYPFGAFRQVLEYAVAMGVLDRNPAERIKNPRVGDDPRLKQRPFEDWDQVEAIADEIDARSAAIPIVLVGTGLRPEELWPLERGDVDLDAGVLTVTKVYTQGVLKVPKKSSRQLRRVPLRRRVVEAIRAMPPRIDTKLLFPAARGGYIDIEKWRHREWAPALRVAGIDHRRIYDCRHTFASWALGRGEARRPVQARPLHGHLGRGARAQLRAPDARRREPDARAPRRLRRRSPRSPPRPLVTADTM
jgi:integrase